MRDPIAKGQKGFSVIEGAIVVLLIGVVLAIATPKIVNAMREHRLSMATREVADFIQRAKAQAVSQNKKASLMVDTAGRRLGMAVYDSTNTNILDTIYMPLPQGVIFQTPPSVTAPVTGAPTSSAVSFPAYQGSSTVFKQDFTSRGFPSVAAGTINAIYLTNGKDYRAVTMNSVGGVRSWWWENSAWVGAGQ
jgi:Tfp pilus assembly protein FimT